MKNLVPSFTLYTLCLCFLNFTRSDEFSAFGIAEKDAREQLWSTLQKTTVSAPYFSSSVKTACRAIAPENQAAAVNKAGSLIKTYFNSHDFQKRYADWLTRNYASGETKLSDERKAEIRAYRVRDVKGLTPEIIEPVVDMQIQSAETYTGMEQMLASMPANQRAELRKTIDDGKRNAAFFKKVKPLLKSDFETFRAQYAAHLAEEEIAQKEADLLKNNQQKAAEYEQWKDPNKVLAARLTDFLEKSKGVDFNAQTKLVNNRQKFANPVFEAKNPVWKFCYRIGAAPTNAARAFAQDWLKDLR
jgi:hypothetical protein